MLDRPISSDSLKREAEEIEKLQKEFCMDMLVQSRTYAITIITIIGSAYFSKRSTSKEGIYTFLYRYYRRNRYL